MERRTAIVTGAAQGLGAAYARALADAGASVAVLDIIDPGDTVEKLGPRGRGYLADITSESEIDDVVADVVSAFGSADILVNNAALFGGIRRAPLEDITVEEFERVLRINVVGQFVCVKAVSPHMRRQRWGRIVNISSGAALKGLPSFLHYVTSKGAMVSFTRALARELGADGVTVNAIAPGLTVSESVRSNPVYANAPLQNRAIPREEVPSDLVGTLLWLCSDGAEFVTGQTIAVDGGSVML